MARIIRTSQARNDVLDIWEFIAADNLAAADKLIRQLDEVVRLLAEQPELGSSTTTTKPPKKRSPKP